MGSTPSTNPNSHNVRVEVNTGSSFGRNKNCAFITALTTAGVTAPGSHTVSPTFVATEAAPTTQPSIAPLDRSGTSNITVAQDSSKAPMLLKGIPSTKQYILPTPLKVDHLQVLLQYNPQQDRINYVLTHGFSLEYKGQRIFRAPDNLPMADIKPELIRECLHKVQLGGMWGPFKDLPFEHPIPTI